MRKTLSITVIMLVFILVSCSKSTDVNEIILSDLSGLTREEIISELIDVEYNFYFVDVETDNAENIGLFVGYSGGYQAGDAISTRSAIGIEIFVLEAGVVEYFEVVDMVYDGPYLSEAFSNINYLNPRGGYFEVTLLGCTDGDTARFIYPQDVYDAIDSGAKTTRFLNMDTEETFSGGEEEWGKPASVYTCDILNEATEIILQTDPGDGLLGTYGRLLAWIWVKLPNEDEFFLLNYMVVKQGLAQVKFEFGAGETISYGENTYNEWMHLAEDYAINQGLGQWGSSLDYYWNYDDNEPIYDRWN